MQLYLTIINYLRVDSERDSLKRLISTYIYQLYSI
jgi:hypothetical protein